MYHAVACRFCPCHRLKAKVHMAVAKVSLMDCILVLFKHCKVIARINRTRLYNMWSTAKLLFVHFRVRVKGPIF